MAGIAIVRQAADAVTAVALGLVQRGVGGVQKLVERLPLRGPMGQAGGQGHTLIAAAGGDIARRQLRADALQTFDRLTRIGARQDQQKLFATDAEHRIGAAQVAQQVLRDGLEHVVADQVPAFVVEFLEVIEVDQRQSQGQIFTLRSGQLTFEELIQVAAVVEPGQRVSQGLFA